MKTTSIKQSFENLNVVDTYSLILFILFKLKDEPKYSTLSELMFILEDKDVIYNFLRYYGGKEIKIPTLIEFRTIINALMLYNSVVLEGNNLEDAIESLELDDKLDKNEIISVYNNIGEILKNYNFRGNSEIL